MENSKGLKDISKLEDYKYKTKNEILKHVFSEIMIGNQTICIKGRRKTGKSTLVTELIIQNLMSNESNQVLLISTYGNFNAKKFYEICESFVEKEQKNEAIHSMMKRLKVIQIESENNFHEYFVCLEAIILGFANLSLVVIDSFSFYHHDSYIFEKVYGKPLTREMYMNYYLNTMSTLVDEYDVTILYTLPQHLCREYICTKDFSESDEEEERKIYENIKTKSEKNAVHRFPILVEDDSISLNIDDPIQFGSQSENQGECSGYKPISVDINQPVCADISERINTIEIKESISTEKFSSDQGESVKSELEKKVCSEEISENVKECQASCEKTESEPEKLTDEGTVGTFKTNSSERLEVPNSDDLSEYPSGLSVITDIDSLSDSSSIKSGEGYKSESGTESSATNEKISEKIIATMYKSVQADVIIKLLNISSNCYMMRVHKDSEEFDFNFDITENGIEWDEIPAENVL